MSGGAENAPPVGPLTTTVLPFRAKDGLPLNLHHVTGARPPTRGPVLLVHGAGVRADIFRPPGQTTLADAVGGRRAASEGRPNHAVPLAPPCGA